MDMLNLVEHFLQTQELHGTIMFYSEIILKMIILPCMVWHVGKPNVSIGKAGVVCLIKLMENELIEREKMQENFT